MIINHVTLSNENLGSFRYFALLPKPHLEEMGHKVVITSEPLENADVAIFNKHINGRDVEHIANCNYKGIRTIFHVTDNHFMNKYRNHYEMMIESADTVTCTVQRLREVIKYHTGKDAVVVPDPYYYDEVEPVYKPEGKLKLVWFGHPCNIDGLMKVWEHLAEYDVKVISNPLLAERAPFPVIAWSHESMMEGLKNSDVVIIPSILDEKRAVKSPNRMVDSIRRGKFVIATFLPCYAEFQPYMWVGNVLEGLEWIVKQKPCEIVKKIKAGQDYIREKFSPKAIAYQWSKILEKEK